MAVSRDVTAEQRADLDRLRGEARWRAIIESAVDGIILIPEEARRWCDITELVDVGNPYEVILTRAREQAADLIVLGVQGRNRIDLALFGSTANHVVRMACCPVLTVKI